MIDKVKNFKQFVNENKYWSNSKVNEYKRFIKYYYSKYWKDIGLPEKPLNKITTIGSFGTDKFIDGKSDIDFMLYVLAEIGENDMAAIIDYLNGKLIDEYGEIEGKGGKVEVIGINDKLWFD